MLGKGAVKGDPFSVEEPRAVQRARALEAHCDYGHRPQMMSAVTVPLWIIKSERTAREPHLTNSVTGSAINLALHANLDAFL